MKKVPLLIIGATALGIAAALKNKDSLIIESSTLLGAEYIQAYKNTWVNLDVSDSVKPLYEPMKEMNIVSDNGFVHLFPVSGVLSGLLKENEISVKFLSTVIGIKKMDGVYTVDILNRSGIETVIAEKILDTTTEGTLHYHFDNKKVSKSICGLLSGPAGCNTEEYSFVRGRFPSENILVLNVENDCSFSDARIRLTDLWIKIHTQLNKTRFATCAQRFAYEFASAVTDEVDSGWIWKPSVSFGDLFASFREGLI